MANEQIQDGGRRQHILSERQSSLGETLGPAISFDRLTSFGNFHFKEEIKNKGLGYLKQIFDRNPVLVHLWNEMLVILCVIATSLDPLFCYILLVDEQRKCVEIDKKLRTRVVILRSIIDLLYIILLVCHFQCGYSSLKNVSGDGVWARVWKFLLSYFTVDILAVLPLPQVVVLFVIPNLRGSQFIVAMRSLKYILLTQYVPRVFRIYSFLKKVRWSSSILPESAGAKAAFNLFLYLLASHVIGAFWYLFTIERKLTCWQQRCQHCTMNCINHVLGDMKINDICSEKAEYGSKSFDFGIFTKALHIVNSRDFIGKLSCCFWWGLQKLSSLGQDLETSDHIWEIYFAVTVTISGLVLFAVLVGNLQMYLQSTIARLEEMRLRGQDIELWMAYHSLPQKLKKQITKYEQYKWRETSGVNVEKLLRNLPRHLRRKTKKYLCAAPIQRVLKFQNMDNKLMRAICDYLRPVIYIERNIIIQEGEPLDEMIFITRGKVLMYSEQDKDATSSPKFVLLEKDDVYGEELLDWALLDPFSTIVPRSTKTIRAHSKVEAFMLMANDLKIVISKFWWLLSKNCPSLKDKYLLWAVIVLQRTWRKCYKKKCERLKSQSVNGYESKNSQKLGAQLLSSMFAARVLHRLRSNRKAKADSDTSDSSRV